MKTIVARIPVPLCGVALAIATIGTMLESFAPIAWYVCGVIATVFLALILAKCVMFPQAVVSDLNNPVFGGVAGTFAMLLIGLSVYLARISWSAGFMLWIVGLGLFLTLMVRYLLNVAIRLPIMEITPAYLIPFIGYQAAAISAPAFQVEHIGYVLSIIGNVLTPLLMALALVRFLRHHPLKKPQTPLICILTAPFGMALASYLSCTAQPNETFALVLQVLAFVFLIVGLIAAGVSLATLPFAPTFGSLTFPFVISASGTAKYAALLEGSASALAPAISTLAHIQLVIAVVLVTYVTIRFVIFLLKPS